MAANRKRKSISAFGIEFTSISELTELLGYKSKFSYNFILKFLRRLNKEEKSDRVVLKKALKSLMLAFKDSIPVYNNYQKQQKQSLKLAKRSA